MNVYWCRIFVVDGSKTALYLSVDNLATVSWQKACEPIRQKFSYFIYSNGKTYTWVHANILA